MTPYNNPATIPVAWDTLAATPDEIDRYETEAQIAYLEERANPTTDGRLLNNTRVCGAVVALTLACAWLQVVTDLVIPVAIVWLIGFGVVLTEWQGKPTHPKERGGR